MAGISDTLRQQLFWCDTCKRSRVVVYSTETATEDLRCPNCHRMVRATSHRGAEE